MSTELIETDDEQEIVHVTATAVAELNRSEVEAQLDAAHKYRRSITSFRKEAITLATMTRDIAEACIYSIPRDGKQIAGPSVRLAEIVASCYGNLHVAARVVDVTDREVVAQGGAWDLEKNLRVTVETRRKIVSKSGRRYSEDMIVMTGNAAASIALRNAIFRVVPRSYVDEAYRKAKEVAIGDAKTLTARRQDMLKWFADKGIAQERVFKIVDKRGIEDVQLDDLEILVGLSTRIKNGEPAEDVIPVVMTPVPGAEEGEGKRISLKPKKDEKKITVKGADGQVIDDAPEPGSDG